MSSNSFWVWTVTNLKESSQDDVVDAVKHPSHINPCTVTCVLQSVDLGPNEMEFTDIPSSITTFALLIILYQIFNAQHCFLLLMNMNILHEVCPRVSCTNPQTHNTKLLPVVHCIFTIHKNNYSVNFCRMFAQNSYYTSHSLFTVLWWQIFFCCETTYTCA